MDKNFRKRQATTASRDARKIPTDWLCQVCGGCASCGSRCVCFDDPHCAALTPGDAWDEIDRRKAVQS